MSIYLYTAVCPYTFLLLIGGRISASRADGTVRDKHRHVVHGHVASVGGSRLFSYYGLLGILIFHVKTLQSASTAQELQLMCLVSVYMLIWTLHNIVTYGKPVTRLSRWRSGSMFPFYLQHLLFWDIIYHQRLQLSVYVTTKGHDLWTEYILPLSWPCSRCSMLPEVLLVSRELISSQAWPH